MLFEIIAQSLIGVIVIAFSIPLLLSGKHWKMGLGMVMMAGGLTLTLTGGDYATGLIQAIPQALEIKTALVPLAPYMFAAAFLAWFFYIAWAYFERRGILSVLLQAFRSGKPEALGYLEAAKTNAMRDQLFWMVGTLLVTALAFVIMSLTLIHQDFFEKRPDVIVVAMAWVFVAPPFAISMLLKKPSEIKALKDLNSLQNIKGERVSDYRELIAVMDEIKDERLKRKLDGIIIDGLSESLIDEKKTD